MDIKIGRTMLWPAALLALWTLACGRGVPGGDAGLQEADLDVPEPVEIGSCQIAIGGDESHSLTVRADDSDVGSDYWQTDATLRQLLTVEAAEDQRPPDEIPAWVEATMQQDPRFLLLLLSCVSQDLSITLVPADGSGYGDVSFGPKEYVIAADGEVAPVPGNFVATLLLTSTATGQPLRYTIDTPGRLYITRFDLGGIAGRFSFEASATDAGGLLRHVTVAGQFDYACVGDRCSPAGDAP